MKKGIKNCFVLFGMAFALTFCACHQPEDPSTEPSAQPSETMTEGLPAPQNLRMEGRILIWDAVENATGYIVYFNNEEHETTDCYYLLYELTEPDTYEIELMAFREGEDCDYSAWVSISYTAEEIVASGYDEKGLAYYLLEDGTGYEVSKGYANLQGELVIPEFYKGLPVKRIKQAGFAPNSSVAPDVFLEYWCNSVTTSIRLPSRLEEIGAFAFSGFIKLEEIVIPESVTKIGYEAFGYCKNLKQVTFPSTLKVIPEKCFYLCGGLDEITFPETLEEIGRWAFKMSETYWVTVSGKSQARVRYVENNLTKIVIPDSVKKIGNLAFSGCLNLTDITLPRNLDGMIVDYPFGDTGWYNEQPEGLVYLGDILYSYKGEMPENTTIEVPSTVKYIGGLAFCGAENLQKITIPDGVKFLGNYIFSESGLSEVKLPSDLTEIPTYTFCSCGNLTGLEIPDSVTRIGEYAFCDCDILTRLELPDSVIEIGDCAMLSCDSLEEVVLPAELNVIGTHAFQGCDKLQEVILPSKLEVLGSGAFYDCDALQSIFIPKSVEIMYCGPVMDCDSLTYVYYEGTAQEWNALKAQYNVYHVIDGKLSNIAVEKPFSEATIYFYSETEPTETGDYWHYVDGSMTLWFKEEISE